MSRAQIQQELTELLDRLPVDAVYVSAGIDTEEIFINWSKVPEGWEKTEAGR